MSTEHPNTPVSAVQPNSAEVVTICGSMRFRDLMLRVAEQETAAGRIVLMPFAVVAPADQDGDFKAILDRLHREKIDHSDRVIVVSDETGYYGDSTRGEVDYASRTGKVVSFQTVEAVQPDSGTLREQIASVLHDRHDAINGPGGSRPSYEQDAEAIHEAITYPLVERLHQAEAERDRAQRAEADRERERDLALGQRDAAQRGQETLSLALVDAHDELEELREQIADPSAEERRLTEELRRRTLYAKDEIARLTAALDQANTNAMTCSEQAAFMEGARDQLRADLAEARRELNLATAEAEDARDGGLDIALELVEARASEIEMMADVERLEESRFRWAEEAAELERQRDEAREKGHGLLDDLVREQTARANAEADVRKAIERAGGSWRATVEAPTDAIALLYRAPKDAIALLYPDMANEDKTVGDLPAEEWQRFHAGVTGARRAETPDVHARVDELERALEDAPGAEHAKEWNADSTGTGGQA